MLNNPNDVLAEIANAPFHNSVDFSDKPSDCPLALSSDKSFASEFCNEIQNLYSSTGTIPINEQAKKPLRTLMAVVLMDARPF